MANQDLWGNNAATTLAANVTTTPASGTSETWTVTSTAAPFPQITSGQQLRATVANQGNPTDMARPEIVWITSIVDSTHFGVLRAMEGTTAKTHSSGDTIANTVTAGFLTGLTSASVVLVTTSGSVAIPSWAGHAHMVAVSGGGGGGGSNGSQGMGGGGAAGPQVDQWITLNSSDTALNVTIGAAGLGGTSASPQGGTGGATSAVGNNSSVTYVQSPTVANGGGIGAEGAIFGTPATTTGGYPAPGSGGNAGNTNSAIPTGTSIFPTVGGGCGGNSSGTAGGSGGKAQVLGQTITLQAGGTIGGQSPSANAGAGGTASQYGCGGGGAGAAYGSGTWASGGNGAKGALWIEFRP